MTSTSSAHYNGGYSAHGHGHSHSLPQTCTPARASTARSCHPSATRRRAAWPPLAPVRARARRRSHACTPTSQPSHSYAKYIVDLSGHREQEPRARRRSLCPASRVRRSGGPKKYKSEGSLHRKYDPMLGMLGGGFAGKNSAALVALGQSEVTGVAWRWWRAARSRTTLHVVPQRAAAVHQRVLPQAGAAAVPDLLQTADRAREQLLLLRMLSYNCLAFIYCTRAMYSKFNIKTCTCAIRCSSNGAR